MKRSPTPIGDLQRHTPPATSAAATPATVIVQSTQIDKDPLAGAKTHGKRKRSRSHMATTTIHLDSQEDLNTKRTNAMMPSAGQRGLGDQGASSGNSDEDEELVSPWSAPPSEPVPPELVCRYPNKPCPHPRANKKHGELHSLCAYHRFKAQQYQRKLESKKRNEKKEGQCDVKNPMLMSERLPPTSAYRRSPASATTSPQGHPGSRQRTIRNRSTSASAVLQSPENAANPAFEPFKHPVRLHEGDIHLLRALLLDSHNSPPKAGEHAVSHTHGAFWNPHQQQHVPPSGPAMMRHPGMHPNNAASAAQHHDGSYALNLEGFTFTSESL